MIPLLPVPLALLALALLRPGLLTSGATSPVALATGLGVAVAGASALVLVARRWSRRAGLWTADVVVLALFAAVFWPAFRERTLVEDFPVATAVTQPIVPATPPATPSPLSDRSAPTSAPDDQTLAQTATPAPSGPAKRSDTPRLLPPSPAAPTGATATATAIATATAPAAQPVAPEATRSSSGRFQGIDHSASGTAALYDVSGELRLRFEDVDFQGTPSPSVHLVPAGQRSPSGGLRLGALKAEHGSFSYGAPASYRTGAWTVLVWCDRYDVPIAAADLA